MFIKKLSDVTASDLITFIQALRKGKQLSDEMTEEILKPQIIDEEANGARGYIWKYGYANIFILDNEDSTIRAGHTGEEFGVSCRLYYYPSLDIDVVILGNQ